MNSMRKGQSRKTIFSISSTSNNDNIPSDQACKDSEKKIVRRDNERQRRQQMTFLTNSLRSLLPLERIKGNRSVCDHMHGAVNYITHLKNEIEGLTITRNALRDFCSSSSQTIDHGESGSTCSENRFASSVVVRPCLVGIEIVICSHFPLSKVLGILFEEGLDIVGCASTKVNERLIHTIHSQVDDLSSTNLDLSKLQQKLSVILCSTFH